MLPYIKKSARFAAFPIKPYNLQAVKKRQDMNDRSILLFDIVNRKHRTAALPGSTESVWYTEQREFFCQVKQISRLSACSMCSYSCCGITLCPVVQQVFSFVLTLHSFLDALYTYTPILLHFRYTINMLYS